MFCPFEWKKMFLGLSDTDLDFAEVSKMRQYLNISNTSIDMLLRNKTVPDIIKMISLRIKAMNINVDPTVVFLIAYNCRTPAEVVILLSATMIHMVEMKIEKCTYEWFLINFHDIPCEINMSTLWKMQKLQAQVVDHTITDIFETDNCLDYIGYYITKIIKEQTILDKEIPPHVLLKDKINLNSPFILHN